MTGDDTGFTAGTAVEIDFECVLLSGAGWRRGQEFPITREVLGTWNFALRTSGVWPMPLVESINGRQRLLRLQKSGDQ
jgi:hypothetical protein